MKGITIIVRVNLCRTGSKAPHPESFCFSQVEYALLADHTCGGLRKETQKFSELSFLHPGLSPTVISTERTSSLPQPKISPLSPFGIFSRRALGVAGIMCYLFIGLPSSSLVVGDFGCLLLCSQHLASHLDISRQVQ